jgi:hypothetical protein
MKSPYAPRTVSPVGSGSALPTAFSLRISMAFSPRKKSTGQRFPAGLGVDGRRFTFT